MSDEHEQDAVEPEAAEEAAVEEVSDEALDEVSGGWSANYGTAQTPKGTGGG